MFILDEFMFIECHQASSGQKLLNPLQWPEKIELEDIWVEEDLIKFKENLNKFWRFYCI